MKASFIEKEGNKAKFTLEFTAEELDQAQIDAYKATKDKYVVDGFRKGKAPRKIIEQRYGEGIFLEDGLNNLLSTQYPAALTELEIEPIDRPDIDFGEYKKGETMTLTITVATPPEFELQDYEGVVIEDVSFDVTDEDVENQLESLQKRNSRQVEVTDRAAEDGDTVNIDYKGFDGDNQFEGGTADAYDLKLGSGTFIPGFEEKLIGTSIGDEVEVDVTFPEEYHSADLAGKPVVFKVTVNSIKAEEIPLLDDDFAQEASEFDTLDELRADTRVKLEESATLRAENTKKNNVLEKVFDANTIDIPDVMVEEAQDGMVQEFSQSIQQQGMQLENYLQYIGKTLDEFREGLKEDAFKRVKMRLIVEAIVKDQEFDAAEEEVDAEVAKMAEQYGIDAEQIKGLLGPDQLVMISQDIKNRKAVDYVYENAVVQPASESTEATEDAAE